MKLSKIELKDFRGFPGPETFTFDLAGGKEEPATPRREWQRQIVALQGVVGNSESRSQCSAIS